MIDLALFVLWPARIPAFYEPDEVGLMTRGDHFLDLNLVEDHAHLKVEFVSHRSLLS